MKRELLYNEILLGRDPDTGGDTYEVSSDTYKVSGDSYHVSGDTCKVSCDTYQVSDDSYHVLVILPRYQESGTKALLLVVPPSMSHAGACRRRLHPPPSTWSSAATTVASSIVHVTSELVAGGRVLLSLRLSTPTIAPSPAIATTHVHQLRLQARTAPQRGTSLRFSNDGQAPRAAAVISWCE